MLVTVASLFLDLIDVAFACCTSVRQDECIGETSNGFVVMLVIEASYS
jgi:hypothetical protein